MKKNVLLIFLFLSFAVNLYSQTTWFSLNSGVTDRLNYVSFPSEQTGYIAGNNSRILKTTNAGLNWSSLTNPIATNFQVIYFLNETTGFIGGTDPASPFNGKTYKTTDGGNSWTFTGNVEGVPYGVFFQSNIIGYIYGGVLGMFASKTVNAGNTWGASFISGGLEGIGTISFANANTGIVITKSGMQFRTTNNGGDWSILSNDGPYQMYSSQFINETTGFACGKNGLLGKTTNAGLNWAYVHPLGSTDSLFSLKFTSVKAGYLVGQGSTILQTTDGANTWMPLLSPSGSTLRLLTFTNAQTGYAVGDNGTIIKTTTGILTPVVENSETKTPEKYSLSQNYPNPFNPAANILYSLPKSGFITLQVYDAAGKMIKELVSEFKNAGNYSVAFDATNFSSGVYFYRIEVNGFVDTKRMVLMK
ncbi:MAG: T9SS type A sorting domain-containing protein [Ignavibacteria bacterium]|nr:T9SS type A sorting domain-containing protein [Ignavibacteria bacterium]